MRISEWAQKLGIQVTPFDAVAAPQAGAKVYRVKDIWTTRDGSWDVSNKRGSLPQWARDEYLRKEFDDAGADHHIFGRVLGENTPIHFWTWTDGNNNVTFAPKPHSGWANIVIWSSSNFVPERNERGPWAWKPNVDFADTVTGAGLPANEHVSWFAVWQVETYQGGDVVIPTEPPTEPGGGVVSPEVIQQVNRNRDDIAELKRLLAELKRLLATWIGGK